MNATDALKNLQDAWLNRVNAQGEALVKKASAIQSRFASRLDKHRLGA